MFKYSIIFTFNILIICFAQNSVNLFEDLTIVHLFEWKWEDIELECKRFLSDHGYNGVQISPPNENLIISGRPWWERYQPVSYEILTRSGNETEFIKMTRTCNKVGVRIFVDAVINHMAGGNGRGTAGNEANSDQNLFSGVPYGPNDFHSTCEIQNYQDAGNVRNCQLGTLRDLNQGKEYVRTKIINYLNHLISLGVAGFRIDAAKHMWPADLEYIFSHLTNLNTEFGFPENSRPFIYQEVIDLGSEGVSASDYFKTGHVTEFKHRKSINNVFQGNDKLTYLDSWGPKWGFMDSKYAVVFVDNHDTQRDFGTLNYKDSKKYKMANAFMLAHPYGVTKVMSSYFFDNRDKAPPQDENENLISPKINQDNTCSNGYVCEHRWRQIYNMAKFRKIVKNTKIQHWWSNNDQQISFCRGDKGFIAFTNYGDLQQTLQTCLPSGTYCDIISGNLINGKCSGSNITVDEKGFAFISLKHNAEDGMIAIHVQSKII